MVSWHISQLVPDFFHQSYRPIDRCAVSNLISIFHIQFFNLGHSSLTNKVGAPWKFNSSPLKVDKLPQKERLVFQSIHFPRAFAIINVGSPPLFFGGGEILLLVRNSHPQPPPGMYVQNLGKSWGKTLQNLVNNGEKSHKTLVNHNGRCIKKLPTSGIKPPRLCCPCHFPPRTKASLRDY